MPESRCQSPPRVSDHEKLERCPTEVFLHFGVDFKADSTRASGGNFKIVERLRAYVAQDIDFIYECFPN